MQAKKQKGGSGTTEAGNGAAASEGEESEKEGIALD